MEAEASPVDHDGAGTVTTNVIALYFFPDTRYANSVGVFRAGSRSKQDADIHAFVTYLVNWAPARS